MIEVRKYDWRQHKGEICLWLHIRKLERKLAEDLPELGYIVFIDRKAVCAAFLRMSEGAQGMLEGLISNPEATSLDRHLAIDAVVKRIIETATERGVRYLLAYSIDDGTLERSLGHGFERLPHTLIGLKL